MKIIIGLGNPGKQHENTRHNLGFIALDLLAEKNGLVWEASKKFQAQICRFGDLILVKPQTFVNESGQSAQAILSYYKLLPTRLGFLKAKDGDLSKTLTVIHDDLDIDIGKYKIAVDRGSAGHNGIESIISHLKTKNFRRIRIGIKPLGNEKIIMEKFVVQPLETEERKIISDLLEKIIKEI